MICIMCRRPFVFNTG